MSPLCLLRFPLFVALLTPVNTALPIAAAEVIAVNVTSGRQFSGVVDDRTDAKKLWLRYGEDGITVLRPIDWSRITGAIYNQQTISADELRELAEQIKTAEPPAPMFNPPPRAPMTASGHENDSSQTYADRAREALGAVARVRNVRFDAQLANWDADVEADGLLIHIRPQNASGEISRINGTVHVELTALRGERYQDVSRGRGAVPTRVGRWVRRFSADEMDDNGLQIQLPFQAIHPGFDSRVAAHGLVHLRLVAPGHGVFEHSQDAVRIQPFAPLRDHLQRNGAGRFLRGEMLGRSQ